jgi:hypothetical protein
MVAKPRAVCLLAVGILFGSAALAEVIDPRMAVNWSVWELSGQPNGTFVAAIVIQRANPLPPVTVANSAVSAVSGLAVGPRLSASAGADTLADDDAAILRALKDALTATGIDFSGLGLDTHQDEVTSPGGSYIHRYISVTINGHMEGLETDLVGFDPMIAVIDIENMFNNPMSYFTIDNSTSDGSSSDSDPTETASSLRIVAAKVTGALSQDAFIEGYGLATNAAGSANQANGKPAAMLAAFAISDVPEPATFGFSAAALLGIGLCRRRRNR